MEQVTFKTKEDYRRVLMELCIPLKKCYSQGRALLRTGETGTHYGEKTAGLEGFARILWGLAPLWAGGGESCLDELITEGIIHGTDSEHEEYWGTYGDGEQGYVEMGPLAFALLLAPERIWEPLDEDQRCRFRDWLLQINRHQISDNNWLFFRVLVNCALKRVGSSWSEEQLKKDLERIDEFYLGDGWYSDGVTAQRDYYIGFGMHFYGLLYGKLMEEEDPERSARLKERAVLFAQSFLLWFGERGEALPYGRSLTYRFAQGCFWSALAYADVEALPWGVIKGILNRHFRYWFSQPILDGEDKLTLGYTYPNLHMCEGYNSPQSPYWSLKSFLVLALSETHPFWKAKEEPLPKLPGPMCQIHPGMLIRRREDGYVTALASGQYAKWEPVHMAEKYEKFAYSSYFGFQVPRSYYSLSQAAPDNMLAFLRDGFYHVRRQCKEVRFEGERLWSSWSPMEGVMVETELVFSGEGHVRTHTICSDRPYTAVEGGFALPWREMDQVVKKEEIGFAGVSGPMGSSSLRMLEGEGKGGCVLCEANVNLLYPRTILPYLTYEIPAGCTRIRVYIEGVPGNET